MKTKVLNRLQEQLEAVIEFGYPMERIVGIFLYGSQNYGFATKESDIDSKVIILPTIEEMCLNKQWISTTLHLENGEQVDIKDIRAMRENWFKQNINFIEILFTEYKILNPRYEELFNELFIDNREQIANIDKYRGIKSIVGQMDHSLSEGMTNDKKLYNAERLCYFLENWIIGSSYEKCLKPMGQLAENIKNIKAGTYFESNEQKIERAKELIAQGNFMTRLGEQFQFNGEAAALLDKGVVELVKASFIEPEVSALSKEEFFSHLTHLEHQAYNAIVKEIGSYGTVVVSKLVKDTSISRPVYNNLLEKLKLYNIAEINNMGVKGTGIKIIHSELKTLAGRPH